MHILICGYIGGGNCGDEAICDRLIAAIRRQGHSVTLLSLSPKESALLHQTPSVSRRTPTLLKAISRCDLLILGGGTLLQTETSCRSTIYYLTVAALAAILGKGWILIGGIDPLKKGIDRYAEAILPTANAFFLRDENSIRRAQALAPKIPCLHLPDSALLPFQKGNPKREKPRRPYVLVCPKAGVIGRAVAKIAKSARNRGFSLVFLAMSREDEGVCAALAKAFGGVWVSIMTPYSSACRRVKAETILAELPPQSPHRYFAALPCELACRLISGAEEVHSARLHGLIFAKKAEMRGHILPDGTKQWKFSGFQGSFSKKSSPPKP